MDTENEALAQQTLDGQTADLSAECEAHGDGCTAEPEWSATVRAGAATWEMLLCDDCLDAPAIDYIEEKEPIHDREVIA